MPILAQLRTRLFGISPVEATFARRGFSADDLATQRHLERVGQTFIEGYLATLDEPAPEKIARRLVGIAPEFRGFAYEGAAMALALLDMLLPFFTKRLPAFLDGPGSPHVYMVHVGAGWAAARVPWVRRRIESYAGRFDPLLGWLVIDGFGFHEGYFHPARAIRGHQQPRGLSHYGCRAFDHGLGRSLWFVEGASPERIVATISGFEEPRHSDLWSGVGLACAYAGGAPEVDVETLKHRAGFHHPALAQGGAFAAKTRQRAGNPAAHTELACRILCGSSADEAAAVTDRCLPASCGDASVPAYETWRCRIQAELAGSASHLEKTSP